MKLHTIKVPLTILKEENTYIAYSPALDLSSCGKTAQEAQKNFGKAVSLLFAELEEMGTTEEVLCELGPRQT